MRKNKIYDCITFFDENLITNARIEILNEQVDYFVICESRYDHKRNKKEINFNLQNKQYEKKVRHLIIDENFPKNKNLWKSEQYQREKIFNGIFDSKDEDIILYSDSDEIPNPEELKKLDLKKKICNFYAKFFCL